MSLCDLDEIKIQVKRQYEDCHGYSGNKKAIYREAILAVRSILHSAKTIDAVPVDEKLSTPNWTVYRTKEQCECGGKYTARAFLDDSVLSSCDKETNHA